VPQENTCGYGARVSGAMFYNYFRSYSPATGRYTQPDPIGLGGGWNRFGYARQNPFRYRDPTGLVVGVDDLAIGGLVATTGCLLSQGCRDMIGNAMATAASSAGSAISSAVDAIKNLCKPDDWCERRLLEFRERHAIPAAH
jgi:RHS repeat-associated protein